MIGIRDLAAATLLAAGVFWGARELSSSGPPRHDVRGALAQVRESGLCLAGRGCVDDQAARTLLIYLRQGDCEGASYDAAVLEELFRTVPRRRLNVVGVVEGMTRDEARAFAVASGITYPLFVGWEGLGRDVRTPRGATGNRPVKLLLDGRGRVVRRWTSRTEVWALRDGARALRDSLAAGRL